MLGTVDIWAAVGNLLFAASCIPLVLKIWRHRSVEGLSGWAVACWLMGFTCLFVYFTIRFNVVFFVYELYGVVMMAAVAAGWLKFSNMSLGEGKRRFDAYSEIEERLKAIGLRADGSI